jgi:hypothetical protein
LHYPAINYQIIWLLLKRSDIGLFSLHQAVSIPRPAPLVILGGESLSTTEKTHSTYHTLPYSPVHTHSSDKRLSRIPIRLTQPDRRV